MYHVDQEVYIVVDPPGEPGPGLMVVTPTAFTPEEFAMHLERWERENYQVFVARITEAIS